MSVWDNFGWFGLCSTCRAFVSRPLKLQNLSKIGIPSLFLKFVQTLRNFLDWKELFEQKNSYGWKDEWCCVAMQLLRHDEVAKGQLELPSAWNCNHSQFCIWSQLYPTKNLKSRNCSCKNLFPTTNLIPTTILVPTTNAEIAKVRIKSQPKLNLQFVSLSVES